MSKIVWDQTGERFYETGIDHGVLYPKTGEGGAYAAGVAWNGLTSVSESPSGAEATALYADNIKYLNLVSNEEFGGTIEAYTYPEEFEQCDGSVIAADGLYITQQARKEFGFAYRTRIGNDVDGDSHGYKLHLVYSALASTSDKDHSTVNDSPEAVTFSWEFTTTPVNVENMRPTAHLVIDSTKANASNLAKLEDILYGSALADARLPLPEEVIAVLNGQEVQKFVVAYLPGENGTGSAQSDEKDFGVDLTLKGAIFTRSSYTQIAWATADGGAAKYALAGKYTANADATLYPVWEENE